MNHTGSAVRLREDILFTNASGYGVPRAGNEAKHVFRVENRASVL